MKTLQILEPKDTVKPTDWCRPLRFESMSGGHSDSYSFECMYSGLPENNAKWVRVEDTFGPCWFGKPASDLQEHVPHEFVRGDMPEEHRLKGHKSLSNFLANK